MSTASYYPHWACRDGNLTSSVFEKLLPGTIVGVHHNADKDAIQAVVKRGFMVSWYSECNLSEGDDEMPKGFAVSKRIVQAGNKNRDVPAAQRAGLLELDAARYKFANDLPQDFSGNDRAGFERDTENVLAAGFKYLAKSPSAAMFQWLKMKYRDEFTPRVVYEDLLVDSEYMSDFRAIRKAYPDIPITVICHRGAYGGAPGTTGERVGRFCETLKPEDLVEVWHGRPTGGAILMRKFPDAPSRPALPPLQGLKSPASVIAAPVTPVHLPAPRIEGTTKCVTFARTTNVRSIPSTDGEIRYELPYGTPFWAHAREGDWFPVDLKGDGAWDGFMHRGLVRSV
jgi:hypothetical protein